MAESVKTGAGLSATVSAGTVTYCRIQVRLDGAAMEGLERFRAAEGGLTISEAVRRLCREARGSGPVMCRSVGRRLTASLVESASARAEREEDFLAREAAQASSSALVPLERVSMREGYRKPGDKFWQMFWHPRDIGVRLDRASWEGLSVYMQWRGLTASAAVRELCVRAGRWDRLRR